MIDQGATTIWENWEGPDGGGVAGIGSLNHYSKGAVISFLHRHVAGLRPDEDHPGYERFTVAPMPGGGLTSAEAIHDARRGRVRSAWHDRRRHVHPRGRGPAGGRGPARSPRRLAPAGRARHDPSHLLAPVTLDPFFAARFAEVRDVTWNYVYGGDPVAIDKAIALVRGDGR